MIDLYQWKSNAKAIANLSVTTKNALVGDGANQDNQNQRRMHQICEKSSPQMWANHVLHMRAILSRLITFCSPHQIFQQMHLQCKQLGRKSEQKTNNQIMHINIKQCSRNYLCLSRRPGPTTYHQGCSHFEGCWTPNY